MESDLSILCKIIYFYFSYVSLGGFVHINVIPLEARRGSQRASEGVRFPGTGVAGGYKLSSVGAGN